MTRRVLGCSAGPSWGSCRGVASDAVYSLRVPRERKQIRCRRFGGFQLMQGKLADMYYDDERQASKAYGLHRGGARACVCLTRSGRKPQGCRRLHPLPPRRTKGDVGLGSLEAIQRWAGANGYINDYSDGPTICRGRPSSTKKKSGAGTSETRRHADRRELFPEDRRERLCLFPFQLRRKRKAVEAIRQRSKRRPTRICFRFRSPRRRRTMPASLSVNLPANGLK